MTRMLLDGGGRSVSLSNDLCTIDLLGGRKYPSSIIFSYSVWMYVWSSHNIARVEL